LFTPRQLLAIGTFLKHTRNVRNEMKGQPELAEAVSCYLAITLDRLIDYSSGLCSWHNSREN